MQAQLGWRSCCRCQGLVNIDTPGNRECFDQQMHDFTYGAEYRALWSEFPENVQQGWHVCTRCARLVFGTAGICCDGSAHQIDEFSPVYGVPFGPSPEGTQPGWRSCRRCQCLCDVTNPGRRCFVGGNHDFAGSFEYSVPRIGSGLQEWWLWCSNCQGFFQGQGTGRCHDGEVHSWGGVDTYSLAYGVAPEGTQTAWRLCTKCSLLAFEGIGSTGTCYTSEGGGGHDFSSALTYSIPFTEHVGAQPGWRWCSKCQLLSYTKFGPAPCPAGETHDHSASGAYSIFPSTLLNGQPGWRGCSKCNAMTFTQLSGGLCRDGSPHDVSTGERYTLPIDIVPDGAESSWRCCSRCQTLVRPVDHAGICADGGPHEVVDSRLYGVPTEVVPEGAQAGWRRCTRCQELAFNGSGVPDGLCAGGVAHDFTGSPAYSVAVLPTAPPLPPAGPRLSLTESEQAIVVGGSGFPAKGGVELSFIVGAGSVKAAVAADDQGAVRHVVDQVVARPAGGLVIAVSASGAKASGRLKSFVPAAVPPGS